LWKSYVPLNLMSLNLLSLVISKTVDIYMILTNIIFTMIFFIHYLWSEYKISRIQLNLCFCFLSIQLNKRPEFLMIDTQFFLKKIGIRLSKKILITNYWNFAQSLKRKLHIRILRKDKNLANLHFEISAPKTSQVFYL
jgi:hypothetical protein